MLADVADEHELDTGRRQEGIFFGALSFSGKASAGIGTWIAGVALAVIDFPRQAAVADVPAATVTRLALVYGPGLLLLAVVAIALVGRYRLSRERHAEIRAALAARAGRGAAPRPGPS
jgi:Na+/melibiose symporter-like transporter